MRNGELQTTAENAIIFVERERVENVKQCLSIHLPSSSSSQQQPIIIEFGQGLKSPLSSPVTLYTYISLLPLFLLRDKKIRSMSKTIVTDTMKGKGYHPGNWTVTETTDCKNFFVLSKILAFSLVVVLWIEDLLEEVKKVRNEFRGEIHGLPNSQGSHERCERARKAKEEGAIAELSLLLLFFICYSFSLSLRGTGKFL